jgi:predicted RNA binding protein YcfA (HicA-like mRNA interferase family)
VSTDPAVSGKTALKILYSLGFELDRVEGSHHVLIRAGLGRPVVVPVHGSQALPAGTLRSIIRAAGLTKREFFHALK